MFLLITPCYGPSWNSTTYPYHIPIILSPHIKYTGKYHVHHYSPMFLVHIMIGLILIAVCVFIVRLCIYKNIYVYIYVNNMYIYICIYIYIDPCYSIPPISIQYTVKVYEVCTHDIFCKSAFFAAKALPLRPRERPRRKRRFPCPPTKGRGLWLCFWRFFLIPSGYLT